MRLPNLFHRQDQRASWLRELLQLLTEMGLATAWTREDREFVVRGPECPFPVVWVKGNGQLEVQQFQGDVDHPGLKVAISRTSPAAAAEVVEEILRKALREDVA